MAEIRKIPFAGDFYDANISYVLYLDARPPAGSSFSASRACIGWTFRAG